MMKKHSKGFPKLSSILTKLAVLAIAFTMVIPAAADAADFRRVIGVTHVDGTYSFTSKDEMSEGADLLLSLGTKSIKLWLTPRYYKEYYPGFAGDMTQQSWPTVNNLTELVQTPYYSQVIDKFDVIAFETYEFSGYEVTYGLSAAQVQEIHDELYDLAYYLLQTYNGTGKTFILQNWEGDNAIYYSGNGGPNPPQTAFDGMVQWLNARQDGITDARNALGSSVSNVNVYGAAEVNVVDRPDVPETKNVMYEVIPRTHMDLYSLSSYSTIDMNINAFAQNFTAALDNLAEVAPDSAAFGNKNIMIGEYSAAENYPDPVTGAILQTDTVRILTEAALRWGSPYMFVWETTDNGRKTGRNQIIDYLNDWSKVYSHTSGLTFDTTNPSGFANDPSRVKRWGNTTESFTYQLDNLFYFTMTMFAAGNIPASIHDRVKIYVSPDNSTWTQVPFRPFQTNTSAAGLQVVLQAVPLNLISTANNYLKIELQNDANGWSPEIGTVNILGTSSRPTVNESEGWWIKRPDGTHSGAWDVLATYFPIPYGKTVVLNSWTNGATVTSNNADNALSATGSWAKPMEQYVVVETDEPGYVALQQVFTGKYVSVVTGAPDKPLRANTATTVSDAEKFRWMPVSNNNFKLFSKIADKYVVADPTQPGTPLIANPANYIIKPMIFSYSVIPYIVHISGYDVKYDATVAFNTLVGPTGSQAPYYVANDSAGNLKADANIAATASSYTLLHQGNGLVALKSQLNGKYVSVQSDGALIANAATISNNEKFYVYGLGKDPESKPDWIALQSYANNNFVAPGALSAGGPLSATSSVAYGFHWSY